MKTNLCTKSVRKKKLFDFLNKRENYIYECTNSQYTNAKLRKVKGESDSLA
jgi:hypothetical protein